MKTSRAATALVLLACLAFGASLPRTAAAIDYTATSEQSFDYSPPSPGQEGHQHKTDKKTDGSRSVQNWKNWVIRALYLLLLEMCLVGGVVFLPLKNELYAKAAYALTGAGFVLAFWEFFCAALLLRLGSSSCLFVFPSALIMGAACYMALLGVIAADVSGADLKESFQQPAPPSTEDARLAGIDGTPGDWPEQDFIR